MGYEYNMNSKARATGENSAAKSEAKREAYNPSMHVNGKDTVSFKGATVSGASVAGFTGGIKKAASGAAANISGTLKTAATVAIAGLGLGAAVKSVQSSQPAVAAEPSVIPTVQAVPVQISAQPAQNVQSSSQTTEQSAKVPEKTTAGSLSQGTIYANSSVILNGSKSDAVDTTKNLTTEQTTEANAKPAAAAPSTIAFSTAVPVQILAQPAQNVQSAAVHEETTVAKPARNTQPVQTEQTEANTQPAAPQSLEDIRAKYNERNRLIFEALKNPDKVVTNADIEDYKELHKYDFTDDEIAVLLSRNLDAKDKNGNELIDTLSLKNLVKLSDEEFELVKKRGIIGYSLHRPFAFKDFESALLKLSDEDFATYMKRELYNQLFLDDREHFEKEAFDGLIHLSDEDFARFNDTLLPEIKKQFGDFYNIGDLYKLVDLSDEELKKAFHFINVSNFKIYDGQFSAEEIRKIINDDKYSEKLNKIFDMTKKIQKSFGKYTLMESVLKLVDLPDKDLDKVIKFSEWIPLEVIEKFMQNKEDISNSEKAESEEYRKDGYFATLERVLPVAENTFKFFKNSVSVGDIKFLSNLSDKELEKVREYSEFIPKDIIFMCIQSGNLSDIEKSPTYLNNKDVLKNIRSNVGKIRYDNRMLFYSEILGLNLYDLRDKSLKETVALLDNLKSAFDYINDEDLEKLDLDHIDKKFTDKIFFGKTVTPATISVEDVRKAGREFFSSVKDTEVVDAVTGEKKAVSASENAIKSFDFTKYGKEGLPLEYSRKAFLKDLSAVLKTLPEAQRKEILRKLEIAPIGDNGEITGYNGILNLQGLSGEGAEGEISKLAKKFVFENKITTGDKKLDESLNAMTKGIPEFMNLIGKQQHGTHQYSLDVHILTVLKECLNNPEFENLSDLEKYCLKYAVILHDIAKNENEIDKNHELTGSLYVRDILNRNVVHENGEISPVRQSTEVKNRIIEAVKNHNWLELFNSGKNNNLETALLFRRTGDLKMARIMAEADLKGVGGDFYERYKQSLSPEVQARIDGALVNINSKGHMIMTNKIVNPSKVPTQTLNGKTYKVINFTDPKYSNGRDLSEIGFEPGTTLENLRFFVHMNDENNSKIAVLLSDSTKDAALCASYISPQTCPTHREFPIGLSLESEAVNVINAHNKNLFSGGKKGFDYYQAVVADPRNQHRLSVPKAFATSETIKLSPAEYSELFAQLQKYKYVSQLDFIPPVKIGNKTLTGSQIKEVLQNAADTALRNDSDVIGYAHNEVNLYAPKTNAIVAKLDSLEEVPQELLDLAEEKNLPIYLFGRGNL